MAPSSELVDTQPRDDSAPRDDADVEDTPDSSAAEAPDRAPEDEPEDEKDAPEREARTLRSGAPLIGAARVERVRQLNRDVKLHFQVRDWEHAVSLLYELVELEPREAVHHGMLARAMARHPVMRKDAERHFIEALRLAPQNADLHFSLGLYYKSFAMHARAQTEFRTALRIRPQHEGAKKHLSTGGRAGKDPLKDMFKKIFG
jgi:tetratricopeptide (TPR) repeat protein